MLAAESVYGASTVGDSWVSKVSMHFARRSMGLAVVNDKIFAIGGSNREAVGGSQYSDTDYYIGGVVGYNEEYDPSTNKWAVRAAMPTPRSSFAIASYQNKIYCMGGFDINGTAVSVNEVYDTSTDKWETKASMPIARTWVQANVVGGQIFLLGGFLNENLNQVSNLNQVYDPENDSWATKTSIPAQAVDIGPSVTFNNQIYVMGAGIKIYDPQTDSWSSKVPQPSTAFYGYSIVATTGRLAPARIYVLSSDEIKIFDPANVTWSLGTPLPTHREQFSAVNIDDQIYVIGGEYLNWNIGGGLSDETPLALNEQYTPIGYGTPDATYLLETIPPKISFESPLSQPYNISSIPINFGVNKNIATASYSLDGQQNVTVVGNTTLDNLPNGSHNLTVYVNDTDGNVGSQTVNFTVETPEGVLGSTAIVVVIAVTASIVCLIIGILSYTKHRRKLT